MERKHDPHDRRQLRCGLTPLADGLMAKICESARLRTRRLLSELSGDELHVVEQAMQLLIRSALRSASAKSASAKVTVAQAMGFQPVRVAVLS